MPPEDGPTPAPTDVQPLELHVVILREMFSDFFTIVLDNGQSEELDIDDLREWFRVRGANMDNMDKIFDHVWNFLRAEVVLENPKEPPRSRLPHAPNI